MKDKKKRAREKKAEDNEQEDEGRRKKQKMDGVQKGHTVLDDDVVEAQTYRPRTAHTRQVYEKFLSVRGWGVMMKFGFGVYFTSHLASAPKAILGVTRRGFKSSNRTPL